MSAEKLGFWLAVALAVGLYVAVWAAIAPPAWRPS